MHYEYIINVGKAEVVVQSTAELNEGATVGLNVEPVNIQIMKKPFVSNFYDGYITKDYKVVTNKAISCIKTISIA